MERKDFRDALYYMTTKELVPKKDTERISRAVNIIGLSGLATMVGGFLIASAISIGPKETFKAFTDGAYSASLNYGGRLPEK